MALAADNLKASASRLSVNPGAMEVTKRPRRTTVPFFIPRGQEYYWHASWQGDERAALAEREAGEVFRFDSDDPGDAARFLDEGELDD